MKQKIKNLSLVVIVVSIFTCCQQKTNKNDEVILNSTPEKEQVLATILRFHDGMRQKDGKLAISTWEKTAASYSISIDSLGESKKNIEKPVDDGRLERIRKWLDETNDNLDEEIFDVQINIDNELAMAWVPYNFYRNKVFSHSGTNAFTLMKFDSLWKIVSVADTRYFGRKIHK